jgi:hypothetical protein
MSNTQTHVALQEEIITPGAEQLAGEDLNSLAIQFRHCQQDAKRALSNALDSAMDAGDVLIAAQLKVKERQGNWTIWLRDNCSTGRSTAMLYMQLARHRPEIENAQVDGLILSLRAARQLISNGGGDHHGGDRGDNYGDDHGDGGDHHTDDGADRRGGEVGGDDRGAVVDEPPLLRFQASWHTLGEDDQSQFLDWLGKDGISAKLSSRLRAELTVALLSVLRRQVPAQHRDALTAVIRHVRPKQKMLELKASH